MNLRQTTGVIMNDSKLQALIEHETYCMTEWTTLKKDLDAFKAKQMLLNVGSLIAIIVTIVSVIALPGMWFMIPMVIMWSLLLWAMFHNFGDEDKMKLASSTKEAYIEWTKAKAATMKYTLEVIYGNSQMGDESGDIGVKGG